MYDMNIKNTPSFKGAMNNKFLLSGLKKISEHGTSFIAGTSLVMSCGVRTFSIMKTPGIDKENKQYLAANSVCSGLVKFAMVEAVALPIENIIKKIDKNPEKYLKKSAFSAYCAGVKNLAESKSYRFITQIFKQSTGAVMAIPKSLLTVALIPFMAEIFRPKTQKKKQNVQSPSKHPSFKHKEYFTTLTARILSLKPVVKFANKYHKAEKDISKHITAFTDVLLTGSSAVSIAKSRDIKEKRKKPLIFNNIISTTMTLLLGYGLDGAAKTGTGKFIKKFSEVNKHDVNLPKYIEGINILRPTLIFAFVYYGLLPIFSAYSAEKASEAAFHKKAGHA